MTGTEILQRNELLLERIKVLLSDIQEVNKDIIGYDDLIIVSSELYKCRHRLATLEIEIEYFDTIKNTVSLSIYEHNLLNLQEQRWEAEVAGLSDRVRTLFLYYKLDAGQGGV